MPSYKFVIKVNGRKVWEGKDLARKYWAIKKKKPRSKISIVMVHTGKETLIVTLTPL